VIPWTTREAEVIRVLKQSLEDFRAFARAGVRRG
jgi:hypothetical protein